MARINVAKQLRDTPYSNSLINAKWTTREGKTIRISKMDDNHVVNSARMLRRWVRDTFSPPINEEGYEDFFECTDYNYIAMTTEAKKRGLWGKVIEEDPK